MNKIHKKRLWGVILFCLGLGLAAAFILLAFKQNLNVFFTPTQAIEQAPERSFNLGGLVKPGSLKRVGTGLEVHFIATDFKHDIPVRYTGVLPDLFREGKGMVAIGRLNIQHEFIASQILAKHDENYVPKY